MKKQKNGCYEDRLNNKILDSIAEAVEDMNDHHLKGAESYSELMEILDE